MKFTVTVACAVTAAPSPPTAVAVYVVVLCGWTFALPTALPEELTGWLPTPLSMLKEAALATLQVRALGCPAAVTVGEALNVIVGKGGSTVTFTEAVAVAPSAEATVAE